MNGDESNLLSECLTTSQDYEALSEVQRRALIARLLYARELIDAAVIVSNAQGAARRDAIVNMELDAMAIIAVGGEPQKTVSPWTIHSSWTFECSKSRLADYISADVLDAVSVPKSLSGDVAQWFSLWAQALRVTFSRLSAAESFCESLAQLIAIDMLVSVLLPTIALLHIGGHLNRQ
jgi:hypothetical protein